MSKYTEMKPANWRTRMWEYATILTTFATIFFLITGWTHVDSKEISQMEHNIKIVLYFTFQSNVLGMVLSWIMVFHKEKEGVHIERFKILTTTSLTLTFIIYWTMLSHNIPNLEPMQNVNNLFCHAFTPIMIVTLFVLDNKYAPNHVRLSYWKTPLLLLAYILAWFIPAISFYYGFGATTEHALYGFLDFETNSIGMSVGYTVGIVAFFSLMNAGGVFLSNRWFKTNKN